MPVARRRLLVTGIVVLAVAGGGWYYLTGHEERATGGHDPTKNPILQPSVPQAVQSVYNRVSVRDAQGACLLLGPTAQAEFARDHGAADCPQAVLGVKVADPSSYGNPRLGDVASGGTQATVSSCELQTTAGDPLTAAGDPLGTFVLQRMPGGWQITHLTREPPCPPGG